MGWKMKNNIERYFEFADKKLHPKTRVLLKFVNMFIFACLLAVGSYMIKIGEIQLGFNLYVLMSLYLIFTKLSNIDGDD